MGASERACLNPKATTFKLLAFAIILIGVGPRGLHADSALKLEPSRKQRVEWLIPARPPNQKQAPGEEEAGKKNGRALPQAELLQPTLDSALPSYQRRDDVSIAGNWKLAASETLPSLVRLWIAAFRKYYPRVNMDLSPPYDGNFCADELVEGAVDAAFISRVLKPEDIKNFSAKFGYEPLSIPISGGSYRHFGFSDAVVVFVHKDNPLEEISYGQLDAIYSSTDYRGRSAITKWGQLGLTGEWSDRTIHVYGIKPWDSAEDLIRHRVLSYRGRQGEWRDDIRFDSVFDIAGHVSDDSDGLGYTGLAYIDSAVRILAVSEDSNRPSYSPIYENVANASYPLTRGVFLDINKSPNAGLTPALEEFVRFILSKEGQQIVLRHAVFLPLRSFQWKKSEAMLRPGALEQ